jgi:selenocysteine-specific elongation factor
MIVVLNKVDLYPEETRQAQVNKRKQQLQKTFATTKFANCPMVEIAAAPGAQDGAKSIGVQKLLDTLLENMVIPKRDASGPFMFSVDHCFPIKGQGTVLTGTILSGSVQINQVTC